MHPSNVSYISYLAPLIITGIAGLTLTSIAFDRVNKSIEKSVENLKSSLKILGDLAPPMTGVDEEETRQYAFFGTWELGVIFLFGLSELSVIPSFANAVSFDFLHTAIFSDGWELFFIVAAYIAVVGGFLISVYVFYCANCFNKGVLPSPLVDDGERRRARERIPQLP